jgi:hypothetical protein
MDEYLGIKNEVDLYRRLLPALNCKQRELRNNNIEIKKEDIWNYLIKTRWDNKRGLDLSTMVSDILNLDNNTLKNMTDKKDNNPSNGDIELL